MGLETRTEVPVFSKNSNGTWIGISIRKKLELRFLKKKLEKGLKPGVNWRLIGNDHSFWSWLIQTRTNNIYILKKNWTYNQIPDFVFLNNQTCNWNHSNLFFRTGIGIALIYFLELEIMVPCKSQELIWVLDLPRTTSCNLD